MFNFIRQLPDLPMLIAMALVGLVALVVTFYTCFFINKLVSRARTSVVVSNIRLKRENKRLRKYISQMVREGAHGRV